MFTFYCKNKLFGTLIPMINKEVNWLKDAPSKDPRFKDTDPLVKDMQIMVMFGEAMKKSDLN